MPIELLEPRRLLSVAVLPAQTPVHFTKVTVDPAPGHVPLEKTLADVDGNGKPDIVVGFDTSSGGTGGIVWYQNPASGNVADKWNRYTIASPGGSSYEDMQPFDLLGTGVPDVIVSYQSQIVWFENPRNTGGNPTTGLWPLHVIGADAGHEIALADWNGDGKIDIATRLHIYLQNTPTSWTTIPTANYGNHSEDGTAAFDSGSGLGAVDIAGTSLDGLQIGWYENPRDHGGSASNDLWVFHAVAPNYTTTLTAGLTYAVGDLNGDGRMDFTTAQNERGDGFIVAPGGLVWWEAPVDRVNGTWIKHTIDASFQDVHRVTLADMNHDGRTDIVFTEQEQSAQKRVGVLYNADGSGLVWNEQVFSTDSGHNQSVGDVNGDGNLDILNVPNGAFTGVNPIQLYMNDTGPTPTAPVIAVSPSNQSTLVHGTATFTVAATSAGALLSYQWRRNGAPISGATGASYSVTNASLSDSGDLFDVIITDSAGAVTSAAAALTVTTPPAPASVAINAGSTTAAGSYVADTDVSGGFTISTTSTIDTSAVANPAPQSVYQSSHYGNFIYTISNLNPGQAYTTRLHFAESSATATGQRLFNVWVNNTRVLTSFDIYAAAGAMNKAITRSFTAIADGAGQITVNFGSLKSNAQVNAIDLVPYTQNTPIVIGLSYATLTQSNGSYGVSGSYANPGPGPVTGTIDYGDGSGIQPLTLKNDSTYSLAHTYDTSKTRQYTVTLTLRDTSSNASSTATATVKTVDVAPSNITFGGGPNFSVPVYSSLKLFGTFTDPGIGKGDTFTQINDWGDGTFETRTPTSAAITAEHVYAAQGVYTLHTTITDADGASTDVKEAIIVGNPTLPASTVLLINAGGSAAGGYLADADFSGGTAYSVGNSIDASAVGSPAPQVAYQTERYGNFSYTIPNLTAGRGYSVRLHFAENFWTATGQRLFNVSINGTTVLSNFDIYATAGARYKAIVQSFNAAANANGQIVITFTTVKDNAKVSAIDITSNSAPIVAITAPSTASSTATLTAAASETGVSAFTYAWSVVDNPPTAPTLSSATAASVMTTFHQSGTYTFQVTATDPAGRSVTTTATITSAAPAWLAPASVATWDPTAHALTVTGAATIIADPGSDEPVIEAAGAAASLTIDPAAVSTIHIGGLTLANAASASVRSLGSARSMSNFRLLLVGLPGTNTPPFSIDSTSTLDLADNDLAILHGASVGLLAKIQSAVKTASNNGAWNSPGLTTTLANSGRNALGLAESTAIGITSFDGQPLGTGATLVKYTLIGDSDLNGVVDLADYTTVIGNFGQTAALWSDGNFDYSGTLGLSDYTAVIRNYGSPLFKS